MAQRVSLCEEDQERFGAGEWLNFDLRNISVADMEFLSDKFGFDPADWPTPFMGELTLDQAGDPDAVPAAPRWQTRAMCWILLRQNGVRVTWDEAGEVHHMLMRYQRVGEPDESPGKEQDPTTPSEASDASTTPPSDTSTD
jgi:hypothetical protein